MKVVKNNTVTGSMPVGGTIPLGAILADDATNMRTSYVGIDDLAADIKSRGLIAPLVVRKHDGNENAYDLIVGFRRYKALRLLTPKDATVQVPVILFQGSAADAALLQARENLQREGVTTYDLAVHLRKLQDTHKVSAATIATATGKTRQYVAKLIKMLSMHPTIVEAWGQHREDDKGSNNRATIPVLEKIAYLPSQEAQLAAWEAENGRTPTAAVDGETPPTPPPGKGRPSAGRLGNCAEEASKRLPPVDRDTAVACLRYAAGLSSELRISGRLILASVNRASSKVAQKEAKAIRKANKPTSKVKAKNGK